MAHSLSAKKRARQSIKRQSRNRWRKAKIKTAVKAFDEAVKTGDKAQGAQKLSAAFKALDQVAAKKAIHKNKANRTKARLAKRLTKAAAAAK